MTSRIAVAGTLALTTLVAGCASAYFESKRYTAPGGQMVRELDAANSELSAAQRDNARLRQVAAERGGEIEQDARRIRALETDLRQQDAQLKAALNAKRISQSHHDKLKRELDAIRAETQNVELENQRATLVKKNDPKADSEKAERLRKLEQRRTQLDTELKVLSGS